MDRPHGQGLNASRRSQGNRNQDADGYNLCKVDRDRYHAWISSQPCRGTHRIIYWESNGDRYASQLRGQWRCFDLSRLKCRTHHHEHHPSSSSPRHGRIYVLVPCQCDVRFVLQHCWTSSTCSVFVSHSSYDNTCGGPGCYVRINARRGCVTNQILYSDVQVTITHLL